MENFLKYFPSPADLIHGKNSSKSNIALNPNGHIHTPYSFSAFSDIGSIFSKAAAEGINVLGINDFYVADGYEAFLQGAVRSGVFPLFNIEFIGLMKDEQSRGIRINDPNNPGRIYFCGKGLDFPFHLKPANLDALDAVKEESQVQLKAMLARLNNMIKEAGLPFHLDFEVIRKSFAKELVRERHIAKAVRSLAAVNFSSEEARKDFLEMLYGGKKSRYGFDETAAIENEIRSNILKAGGTAFVEEDEKSFLPVNTIISIIADAGGIPCYPVLLDDPSGKFTEFESDPAKLSGSLRRLGVGCIELIPGRNSHRILEDFTGFFDSEKFVITFGTEHNTPEMVPLNVTARGGVPLGARLGQINRRGVSVIAAHQYLRSRGENGFIKSDGRPDSWKIDEFASLGEAVIQHYLGINKNEN